MRLGETLCAEIDDAREDLVALCADLVAAPSVNPPGDTRAVAEVARAWLERRGLPVEIVTAAPSMPNLVVRCAGAGDGPHLVLNGHLDTMEPGDERRWTVPPYALTRRDGRLSGLGMGNMKGAVAALCLAAAVLHAHREAWPGCVTLTLVSDEVCFGDHGAAHLLAARPDLRGDALLSGEGPGFMRLAVAEKGMAWVRLDATSDDSGHASKAVEGVSAIARLARAVVAVDRLNQRVAAPPAELAALDLPRDDPGLRLSANIGVVSGGTVPNQIATRAHAEVDLRLPPGLGLDDVDAAVGAAVAGVPGVTWRRTKGWDANYSGAGEPLVQAIQAAITAVRGTPAPAAVRLPASDASRWRALGVPAVCYGPQPTYSAGIDDYALEQDVVDCAKVYALTALRLAGAS